MRKGKEISISPNTVGNLIEALGFIDNEDAEVGLTDSRVYDEYPGRIVITRWTDQESGEITYEAELADNDED